MYKIFFGLISLSILLSACSSQNKQGLHIDDIPIRDPFIYVDHEAKQYYMYAQNGNRSGDFEAEPVGVEVYTSDNLTYWQTPKQVLTVPKESWARKWVWAPEVFKHNEKFYMFVTLTGKDKHEHLTRQPWWNENWPDFNKRGTQIFVADSPLGPFKAFSNKPHTPEESMALDGTLYKEQGRNYMIYCHEWVETYDGTVEVLELNNDFSQTIGKPSKLFSASDAPWARSSNNKGWVTDGVFLHRTQTGKLVMIWSSFGENQYAVGQAISESGTIKGPWIHVDKPLFKENGGHGMLFTTLEGQLVLALHQPNSPDGAERLHLFDVDDSGDQLQLIDN